MSYPRTHSGANRELSARSSTSAWCRIVARLALAQHLSKAHVESVLRGYAVELEREVSALGRVAIPGLGVFSIRRRKGRLVRNPVTGESMWLAPTTRVGFRPSKHFKGGRP